VDRQSYPKPDFTMVRLLASNDALLRRLEKREIGSSIEDQVRRTLRQANEIATLGSAGVIALQTDGKAPQELASELLDQIGWLDNRQ
jgi:ribose 1,5-bisphosphokinase PhnN